MYEAGFRAATAAPAIGAASPLSAAQSREAPLPRRRPPSAACVARKPRSASASPASCATSGASTCKQRGRGSAWRRASRGGEGESVARLRLDRRWASIGGAQEQYWLSDLQGEVGSRRHVGCLAFKEGEIQEACWLVGGVQEACWLSGFQGGRGPGGMSALWPSRGGGVQEACWMSDLEGAASAVELSSPSLASEIPYPFPPAAPPHPTHPYPGHFLNPID
eukprot:71703-Chlamydomonas_euryale.AAC.2